MISDRLQKIFDEKVSKVDDDRDRLVLFYYLCKRGTATQIMKQFELKRQTVYEIMDKYKHLGITPEYRKKMWEEDLGISAKEDLTKINWKKKK